MCRPRLPTGRDVITGIDQVLRVALENIPGPRRRGNPIADPKEHATTLPRIAFACVRQELVERPAGNLHSASITTAMPIPPPMQSDATP